MGFFIEHFVMINQNSLGLRKLRAALAWLGEPVMAG